MIRLILPMRYRFILPVTMMRIAGTNLITEPFPAPRMLLSQYSLKQWQGTIPLIYSGQEEPLLRALPFFEKDTIVFSKLERVGFYKKLLALRKKDPALSVDASFEKIKAGDDKAIYAFTREKNDNKIFVILNL